MVETMLKCQAYLRGTVCCRYHVLCQDRLSMLSQDLKIDICQIPAIINSILKEMLASHYKTGREHNEHSLTIYVHTLILLLCELFRSPCGRSAIRRRRRSHSNWSE